jgi:hypothetical protein
LRTGHFATLSERDYASIREFREFCETEEANRLEAEDQQGYETYLQTLAQEQARTPKAYQITPLPFEEWRQNLPVGEADPKVRALVGTKNALTKAHVSYFRNKVVNQSLDDDDLLQLGFDLRQRHGDNSEVNPVLLRQSYDTLRALHASEFDHDLHFGELSKFIDAYGLDPNLHNLESAFAMLWHLGIIQPKAAKPEPNPALNRYDDNLGVEPDSELEHDKTRRKYREEIVVTDPRTGQGYTQYQLDHVVDADTYKRLVIGQFKTLTIRDVIKPGLK